MHPHTFEIEMASLSRLAPHAPPGESLLSSNGMLTVDRVLSEDDILRRSRAASLSTVRNFTIYAAGSERLHLA